MMDAIVDRTLERFVLEGCISRENADIYRFGLECMFLKAIHYVSYFLIALLFHSAGSLLITACIFAPLRSRIGGYHAKNRMRCYVFSCFMILLLCLLNRYQIPEPALFCGLLSADMIIYLLAPAADENNPLDSSEAQRLRRQAVVVLLVANVVLLVMLQIDTAVSRYMFNGIVMAAALLLFGKMKAGLDPLK